MIKLEQEFGVDNTSISTAKSITEWRMLNDMTIGEIRLRDIREWFVVYLPLQFDVATQREEIIDNMCRQFIHQVCNKLSHLNDHILKDVNEQFYNDILLVRTRSAETVMKYDDKTRIAYLERDIASSTTISRYEILEHTDSKLILCKNLVTIDKGRISKDSRIIDLNHPFGNDSHSGSTKIEDSAWMGYITDPIDFYYTPNNIPAHAYLSSNLSPEYIGDNLYVTMNLCSCIFVKLFDVWIPITKSWFDNNWQSFPEAVQTEYYMYKSIEGVA